MILALILQAATAGAPASLTGPNATAAPAKPAAVASATPAGPDPNRKICKSEEVTGSRVGGLRVCMTKAEWDERAAEQGRSLGQFQQQALTSALPQ